MLSCVLCLEISVLLRRVLDGGETYGTTPYQLSGLVEYHWSRPVASCSDRLVQIVVWLYEPVARTDPGRMVEGDVPSWCFDTRPLLLFSALIAFDIAIILAMSHDTSTTYTLERQTIIEHVFGAL